MNESVYLKKLVGNKNWNDKNVKVVPLEGIRAGAHQENNEVRANGLRSETFEQLCYEIERNGQLVPVSGSKLRNGMWQLNDGGHRFAALQFLNEKHKGRKFKTVRLVAERHPNAADRNLNMLNANRRYVANVSTDDDVVVTFHRNIADLKVLGTDIGNLTLKDVTTYMDKHLTPSIHGNKLNSLAEKVWKKLDRPSASFHCPVNERELVNQFNDNNPWGIHLPEEGFQKNEKYSWGIQVKDAKGKDWAVYNCSQTTWADQNVTHYSLKKKRSDPKLKVLVVGYNNNLRSSAVGCPVQNYRTKIQKSMTYWNTDPNVKVPFIDRLVFLPQVVTGNTKEHMDSLYTSKGKRITKQK